MNGSYQYGANNASVEIKDTIDRLGYYLIAIYLSIIGILATIGNSAVILIITRDVKLRKRTHNCLLLNLAVADLGISIFGYPFSTASSYAGRWVFGKVGCSISGFMCTALSLTDIHILVTLSIYRYIAVCKPHLKPAADRSRIAVVSCLLCWILGLAWAFAALLGWNGFELEEFGVSCSIRWDGRSASDVTYTIAMTVLSYILPIAIMVYCYVNVFWKAKSALARLQGVVVYSLEDVVIEHRTRGELKVTQMSIIMVLFFIFIWSPYAWVSIWSIVKPHSLPLWLTTFPTIFAKTSCCMNPFIYAATNKNFRQAARNMACLKERSQNAALELSNMRQVEAEGNAYIIETTKEGIYIGQRTVVLPDPTSAF